VLLASHTRADGTLIEPVALPQMAKGLNG